MQTSIVIRPAQIRERKLQAKRFRDERGAPSVAGSGRSSQRRRPGRKVSLARKKVFRAVADTTRRDILDLLVEGDLPVMAFAGSFKMTLPAVSQHLRVLRHAGLVAERREGKQRIYTLRAEPLREVADWVSYYEHFWNTRLKKLRQHLDKNP